MSSYIQSNLMFQLQNAAAYAVQVADSGKTLLIPTQGAAMTITLPPPQDGLRYRFMHLTISAFTKTIIPNAGAGVAASTVTGSCINNNAGAIAVVNKSASANVQFTALAAIGDYVDLNCEDNVWYTNGLSSVVGLA